VSSDLLPVVLLYTGKLRLSLVHEFSIASVPGRLGGHVVAAGDTCASGALDLALSNSPAWSSLVS